MEILIFIPLVIIVLKSATLFCTENAVEVQVHNQHLHRLSRVVYTSYSLNKGDWQHLRLDFSSVQLRLLLNGYSELIDLPSSEHQRQEETVEATAHIGGKPRSSYKSTHTDNVLLLLLTK